MRGRVRVERGAKRIRAYLAGELVADTTRPLLVWEKPSYPTYYFPLDDVRTELLTPTARPPLPEPRRRHAFTLRAGGKETAGAALRYPDRRSRSSATRSGSTGTRSTPGSKRTSRSSRTRATPTPASTSSPSSRHVRVELDGVTIAETDKPTLLFETGLPPATTSPHAHVRMDLLEPSDTVSHCPYKGDAEHCRSATGGALDVAWSYRYAAPREPEDRRPDQLLSREGRPLRRRGRASLRFECPRGGARSRLRARPGRRSVRRGERVRKRDARLHPAELLETPVSRIHPGELPQLQDFVGARPTRRPRDDDALTCRRRSGGCLPTEMALHTFEHGRPRLRPRARPRPQRAPQR